MPAHFNDPERLEQTDALEFDQHVLPHAAGGLSLHPPVGPRFALRHGGIPEYAGLRVRRWAVWLYHQASLPPCKHICSRRLEWLDAIPPVQSLSLVDLLPIDRYPRRCLDAEFDDAGRNP